MFSTIAFHSTEDKLVRDNSYDDSPKCEKSMSPLMAADSNASYTTLQILLEAGAHVNAKDELGDTALIHLCKEDKTELQYYTRKNLIGHNQLNCFDELISKEANIDVRGIEGMTALRHCAKNANIKYIQTLLLKVVNTKVQCDAGRTSLMYTSFYNGDFDSACLKQLIDESDINATDANGDTALLYSISKRNVPVLTAIIEKEPDINIRNIEGQNALMLSSISKSEVFLPLVLKLNPNLNDKDQDGNTALLNASIYQSTNYLKCAKLLIAQKGIDLNAKNNDGETALMIAIEYRI